jgi:hypothetical protein
VIPVKELKWAPGVAPAGPWWRPGRRQNSEVLTSRGSVSGDDLSAVLDTQFLFDVDPSTSDFADVIRKRAYWAARCPGQIIGTCQRVKTRIILHPSLGLSDDFGRSRC